MAQQKQTQSRQAPDLTDYPEETEENEDQEVKIPVEDKQNNLNDAEEEQLADDLDAFEAEKAAGRKKKHKAAVIILCTVGIVIAAGGMISAVSSSTGSTGSSDDSSDYHSDTVNGTYTENPFTSYTITGSEYAFPTRVGDLQADGWTAGAAYSYEELPTEIESDSYNRINLTRNGVRLGYIYVDNLSDSDSVPLEEAYVTDVTLYADNNNGLSFSMPYDITFYETSEDVQAVLNDAGVPYEEGYYDNELNYIMLEYDEASSRYYYEIYFNDGEVSSLTLRYYSY